MQAQPLKQYDITKLTDKKKNQIIKSSSFYLPANRGIEPLFPP